jgi:hypothetical protein
MWGAKDLPRRRAPALYILNRKAEENLIFPLAAVVPGSPCQRYVTATDPGARRDWAEDRGGADYPDLPADMPLRGRNVVRHDNGDLCDCGCANVQDEAGEGGVGMNRDRG